MQRFKRIFVFALLIILMLCMGVSFASCAIKKRENLVPKSLGETEGFYLYQDNERCLTDGTQRETILCEVTIDGGTYTENQFEIVSIEYMQEKKEIYYLLQILEEENSPYYLWHYNYDTKENGLLYTFASGNELCEYRIGASKSEQYYFVKTATNSAVTTSVEGVLFDWDLNVIKEGLQEYSLSDNKMIKYEGNEFSWWKDGEFYSVKTSHELNYHAVKVTENYAYLFPTASDIYFINLNTGEYETGSFPEMDKCSTAGRTGVIEDTLYVTTYSISDKLQKGCKLWKLEGMKLQEVYTLPPEAETYALYIAEDRYINFLLLKPSSFIGNALYDAYYDTKTGEYVADKKKSNTNKRESVVINEYEFYVEENSYGFSWATCYYLRRIHNGKDEILQYYFDGDGGKNSVLFDDIHVR